ncbi:MAG: ribonuclease [Frankiales bacterium]|nr:ribonuclease [Frankiales bacterium]
MSSPAPYTRLEAALGVGLSRALLEQALTHRSYAYEHGGLPTNERLEFLGDSVLGLVVTEALYRGEPELAEGQLAKLRASVVNTRALADVGRAIGLGDWVRLGRGELSTGGHDKNSILADTTEAVIGAVFVERGLAAAAAVVHRLVGPTLERALLAGAESDWKTALQELAAARGAGAPSYVLAGSGPDHARRFVAQVVFGTAVAGSGEGGSKKEAEQHAAEMAWHQLAGQAADSTAC